MDFDFNEASGPQLKLLRQGLLATYQRRSLAMVLMDEFTRTYEELVARGSFEEELFELVITAKREGWLNDLVGATRKAFPNAPAMRTVFETFEALGSASAPASRPTIPAEVPEEDSPLEQLMQMAPGSVQSPLQWGERLNALRRRVCRIDADSPKATGCLIGPDLVLTCDYVLEGVRDGGEKSVRFDYVVENDEMQEGRNCGLADDWLVARQPQGSPDGDGMLDFAVLRLAERVGEDVLADGERRGWLDLSGFSPPALGDPTFMLHHPEAGPLIMSTGKIIEWLPDANRFQTDTESRPGSGGAPVFDASFRLIGLHELAILRSDGLKRRVEIRTDLVGAALRELGVLARDG